MRLRMYHAGDGDCLLLTDRTGTRHMLVDGGRKGTYGRSTRNDLTMDELDVVCVSHIDEDHIAGINALFEDEVNWRRHEFEVSRNLPTREPRERRPPTVGEVWHNALFALLGDDLEVRAQNALAMSSNLLRAHGRHDLALDAENIANGERSAMELARRLAPNQLAIEVNDSSDGDVLTRESARGRRFNRMRVKVIGPSQDDIDRLRVRWQAWIDDHPTAIDELRDELRADENTLRATASSPIAADLGAGVENITAPNLASIILMVEERIAGTRTDQSILLTGDGSSAEILEGMAAENEIEAQPAGTAIADLADLHRRHVTVFKIPHHGAEANVTEELVARITADHYVFCGNGAHHNPELTVVRALAEARFESGLGPDENFTFWFSSGSRTPRLTAARRTHMENVETEVADLIARSNGRMSARFVQEHHFLDVLE